VDLLAVMRRAPGAEPALAALDGEPAVHVVGGAVRDALLGRVPRELDFVVEGDAAAVARRAAARLGGTVVVHERFGTATVHADAAVFDVVAARSETYARPGALPDVRVGASLREDLARRDFTVNAIALHVADGAVTEWPGAREDLAAGRLRVLHDRSFADDPTRLLRLARYAPRLGFEVDRATDGQAAAAVAGGAVATVSGGRLGSELRLLLREPQPAALRALERHGLGAAVVHPRFAVDPEAVAAVLGLCPAGARADLAALAACVVGAEDLGPRLDRLELTARERAIVLAASAADRLAERLAGPASDPDLWRTLRRERPEAVAVAGALGRGGPAEAAARRWLEAVRHRRLAITGDDLVAAGLSGPAVGAALEAAQLAMLAGEAPGRAEQLEAGVAAAGRH
jgi:tRNA nucleotidyltransferase (CCA-adding enzyme)